MLPPDLCQVGILVPIVVSQTPNESPRIHSSLYALDRFFLSWPIALFAAVHGDVLHDDREIANALCPQIVCHVRQPETRYNSQATQFRRTRRLPRAVAWNGQERV